MKSIDFFYKCVAFDNVTIPSTIRIRNNTVCTVHGSDGSAAGGRYSDQSEWQRSIKSRTSVSPKILSHTATEIACGGYPAKQEFENGYKKSRTIGYLP